MRGVCKKGWHHLNRWIVILMLSFWAFADVSASACEASENEQPMGEIIVNLICDGHRVTGGSLAIYSMYPAADKALMCLENISGTVVFSGLEKGCYRIVQETAAEGYKKFLPFYVTIPLMENGDCVYTVNALPKIEPENGGTLPAPPQEDDSEAILPPLYMEDTDIGITGVNGRLPQTGQLQWPVPVLVLLGLGCMGAGRIFFLKNKGE